LRGGASNRSFVAEDFRLGAIGLFLQAERNGPKKAKNQ
jgi:hypothetical protein